MTFFNLRNLDRRFLNRVYLGLLLAGLLLANPLARADDLNLPAQTQIPDAYKNVKLDDPTGVQIPLSTSFEDEGGHLVNLSNYFRPGRPVIIQMGYYGCPMLCDLIWKNLVTNVKSVNLKAGQDFEYVFISIDPTENQQLAAQKKESVMQEVGNADESDGFHFLVGGDKAITSLANTLGFHYQFDNMTHQFAHPAALFVATPDGHVSRTLKGIDFPGNTLHLALVEASQEKIGSVLDEITLICFHYDPATGKYSKMALGLMRTMGAVSVIVMASALFWLFRRDFRTHSITADDNSKPDPDSGQPTN